MSILIVYITILIILTIVLLMGRDRKYEPKDSIPFLVITILFIISRIIFYKDVPEFSSLNFDSLTHNIAIKEIFINKRYSINLKEISNSFTILTYLPIFHYIFGPTILFSGLSNTGISFKMLELLFFLLSSFIVYILIRNYTNKYIALISTCFHIFLFERVTGYTSFFLLPQTLSAIYSFVLIVYILTRSKISYLLVIFNLIVTVLTHFFIGPIVSLLIIFFFVTKDISTKSAMLKNILILFALILMFVTLFYKFDFSFLYEIIFKDYEVRKPEFIILNIEQNIKIFFDLLGFFVLLIIFNLFFVLFKKSYNWFYVNFLILTIVFLVTSNFPYATKMFVILHYLLIISISLLLKDTITKKYQLIIILLFNIVAFVFILWNNLNEYKKTIHYNGTYTVITNYDLLAINYLKDKNGLIISDPLTISIIESTTKLKSNGGIFSEPESRTLIWEFFNGEIGLDEFKKSVSPRDEKLDIYLVYNSRTKKWKDLDKDYIKGYTNIIWKPYFNARDICIRDLDYNYTEKDICIKKL